MKKILIFSLALGMMLAVGGVVAMADEDQPQTRERTGEKIGESDGHQRQNRPGRGWTENNDLLENAEEFAPGIFYLGEAMDKGKTVKGYAFVKYAKGYEPEVLEVELEEACYNFVFGSPISWEGEPEDYVINPANKAGLNSAGVFDTFAISVATWETEAEIEILGEGSLTDKRFGGKFKLDEINSVRFGNLGRGIIGINIIWTNEASLVEWDQIYSNKFDWSLSGEAGKMDFQNIATHELGHAVGLGDLYNIECSEQTMYGYSTEGETKKRSLESGDIAGLNILYQTE